MSDGMSELVGELFAEIRKGDARYGAPASTHESYGVLCEEVAEVFDEIRANKLEGVRAEAIQVAAVAMRLALACRTPAFNDRSVK